MSFACKHSSIETQTQSVLKIDYLTMSWIIIEWRYDLWLIMALSNAFHAMLSLITLNHDLRIWQRCHDKESIMGRHEKMRSTIKASKRNNNKTSLGWIASFWLWYNAFWVGWAPCYKEMEGLKEDSWRKLLMHVTITSLNKFTNIEWINGDRPYWQQ
jgi:hypothetical protein